MVSSRRWQTRRQLAVPHIPPVEVTCECVYADPMQLFCYVKREIRMSATVPPEKRIVLRFLASEKEQMEE
jgi:hypothetical protein